MLDGNQGTLYRPSYKVTVFPNWHNEFVSIPECYFSYPVISLNSCLSFLKKGEIETAALLLVTLAISAAWDEGEKALNDCNA